MTGPQRRVLRGRLGPLVAYPIAAAVLVVLLLVAVNLPGGAGGYGLFDRLALAVIAVGVAWFLHRLAAVRVVVEDAGVTVHNVLRSRRLAWAEIVSVRLGEDDPWLYLDLADGTHLAAMGVQAADGDRARRAADTLAVLVAEHTRPERDD